MTNNPPFRLSLFFPDGTLEGMKTDRAISEGYLRELLLCLPVLGLDLKEIPLLKPADAEKQFFLRGKNISAIGMETIDGFAVLKDSQATMSETRSIPTGLKTLRRCLIEKRILEEKVGQKSYVFTQDYLFASPSTASGVVLGRSSNGRTEWKNSKEQSIKDLEQRA